MHRSVLFVTFALCVFAAASARAQADQIMSAHACSGSSPPTNEVFIYTGANFTGTCAALFAGFYPNPSPLNPGNFGLPNDSISSMKVGGQLRARVFRDIVYGGSFGIFHGGLPSPGPVLGTEYSTMGAFNDVVTSIRVEYEVRSEICNDLQTGEFAVFRDANFGSDCVVLHYGRSYPQPIDMGIANDSISSINAGFTYTTPSSDPNCVGVPWSVLLYANGNFGTPWASIQSGFLSTYLSSFNDVTSSIATRRICGIP